MLTARPKRRASDVDPRSESESTTAAKERRCNGGSGRDPQSALAHTRTHARSTHARPERAFCPARRRSLLRDRLLQLRRAIVSCDAAAPASAAPCLGHSSLAGFVAGWPMFREPTLLSAAGVHSPTVSWLSFLFSFLLLISPSRIRFFFSPLECEKPAATTRRWRT